MFNKVANKAVLLVLIGGISLTSVAQNRIDQQRPDAPKLAAYGQYSIGVKTLNISHAQQLDIVNIDPADSKHLPKYDRPLTVEIWYPATQDSQGETALDAFIRDGKTEVKIVGKAVRDAKPLVGPDKYPLVLISHGYPGNRYLMAHLAENIASKGYVVASIDHTDSTYRTAAAFGSTLVNRPIDQMFTLDQIEMLSKDKNSFLYQAVDTQNTALIGYSMGGYGAVISAGGGVTQQAVNFPRGVPHGILGIHQDKSTTMIYPDSRLKTVIAFAPWGMNYGMWNNDSLKGVKVPMLLIAGSDDDVSGYKKGVRAIWQGITSVERSLLTFEHANHNAGAPMPAPEESFRFDEALGFNVSEHYIDAVWDNVRMNNVSQHFATAWLDTHLKNSKEAEQYLALTPKSNDGVWAKDKEGKAKPEHSYWAGFENRTAKGLRFETLAKGE
ncbi:dienelactone hydrolase [uncultured Paraglaciecola sp.]|uniref:alpha/beta hydrolase family protein n=1 Tax=uncultured Paraglaciecola sp. TaxID=1765024 RepID=UPI0026369AAD|nr:dienelactone hydrolase [uncultured Paraglaciecola sp.]